MTVGRKLSIEDIGIEDSILFSDLILIDISWICCIIGMFTCLLTHAIGRRSIPHSPTSPSVARYGLVAYEYIAMVTAVGDLCSYLSIVSGGSSMCHCRQGRTGVLILTYRKGRIELKDSKIAGAALFGTETEPLELHGSRSMASNFWLFICLFDKPADFEFPQEKVATMIGRTASGVRSLEERLK